MNSKISITFASKQIHVTICFETMIVENTWVADTTNKLSFIQS